MIKKILVVPREVAEKISKSTISLENHAIISICSNPEMVLFTSKKIQNMKFLGCDFILTLYFGDFSKEEYERIKLSFHNLRDLKNMFFLTKIMPER